MTDDHTAKFALCLSRNPYNEVCVCEVVPATMAPVTHNSHIYTGRFDRSGEPIPSGKTCKKVVIYNPHQGGGNFYAGGVEILDSAPRTYTEAWRIASWTDKGSHLHWTTREDALGQVLRAIDQIALWDAGESDRESRTLALRTAGLHVSTNGMRRGEYWISTAPDGTLPSKCCKFVGLPEVNEAVTALAQCTLSE